MIRLAIYYTPPDSSPLAIAAAKWLGRNSISLNESARKPLETLSPKRYGEIIASPFHYGFHGTIKPPFRLAPGVEAGQVRAKLRSFAAKYQSFTLPPLAVTYMHNFFCLKPTGPCKALDQLAADAVIHFHKFRRPANEMELERRRSAGLTPGQEKSLREWGYPYLMDEFRFHLTLTGKIDNEREKQILEKELQTRFSSDLLQSIPFSSLCLFMEKNQEPMRLIESFTLSS
jgi:hypothetical protein